MANHTKAKQVWQNKQRKVWNESWPEGQGQRRHTRPPPPICAAHSQKEEPKEEPKYHHTHCERKTRGHTHTRGTPYMRQSVGLRHTLGPLANHDHQLHLKVQLVHLTGQGNGVPVPSDGPAVKTRRTTHTGHHAADTMLLCTQTLHRCNNGSSGHSTLHVHPIGQHHNHGLNMDGRFDQRKVRGQGAESRRLCEE